MTVIHRSSWNRKEPQNNPMLMQYPVTCEYNSWHEHIPISTEDLYSFLSLHLVYFNCIFFATEDASMCICLHGNNECPRFCYVYRNRGNKWHQGLLFITEDLPLIYAYQCFFLVFCFCIYSSKRLLYNFSKCTSK